MTGKDWVIVVLAILLFFKMSGNNCSLPHREPTEQELQQEEYNDWLNQEYYEYQREKEYGCGR